MSRVSFHHKEFCLGCKLHDPGTRPQTAGSKGNKPRGTLTSHFYSKWCFLYKISRGENGKYRLLMFFYLLVYILPFPPLPNFFGRTNHTNLTRRIDPRHPEPPNSPIPPKTAFSFFRFLGFGPEEVCFLTFKGVVGSVFRASGERGGPFSGLQGREGVRFLGFGGTFQPRLGAGRELGEPADRRRGNRPGPVTLPALSSYCIRTL